VTAGRTNHTRFVGTGPGPCIVEDDHEFEFRSDTVGDYGVVNGTATYCWLECAHCGRTKEAEYSDYPDYPDYEDYD
jgi:hypothetical protein